MPEKTFRLEIVTPDRMVVGDDTVTSVVVPGSEGYIGILAHHAPLLAEVSVGEIDIKRADGTETAIATSGGFLEVSANKVIVLSDTAEFAEEIDVSRAEEAVRRAREHLQHRDEAEVDAARAESALSRAVNRLNVAQRTGR